MALSLAEKAVCKVVYGAPRPRPLLLPVGLELWLYVQKMRNLQRKRWGPGRRQASGLGAWVGPGMIWECLGIGEGKEPAEKKVDRWVLGMVQGCLVGRGSLSIFCLVQSNHIDAPPGIFSRASAPSFFQTFAFWVPDLWTRRMAGWNGSCPQSTVPPCNRHSCTVLF